MLFFNKLNALANQVHPNSSGINYVRKNLRFIMWGLLNPGVIEQVEKLNDNGNLAPIIEQQPKLFEKPLKPFISVRFSSAQRVQLLKTHFELLERQFGTNVERIYQRNAEVLTFLDRDDNNYRIEFFSGEAREGSLGLRLVESATGHSIYSITFNLSEQNGKRTMHIGCLQGTSKQVDQSQEKIKEITRTLHGLRPKALMLELSLMMAKFFEVDEVLAISNNGHIYQALRYAGSKRGAVTFDYDALWEEFGAGKVDKYFFQVPLNPERKDPSTLKKTKRRLYTKRYQLMDEFEEQFVAYLSDLSDTGKSKGIRTIPYEEVDSAVDLPMGELAQA
ncbi:VirK/YbjX family protein [Vibrio hannami]|uniref:VirK/YbjX family protein n=1 Tax=Vibrio hannami TaxID=2717094 RepID=UPI00240FE3EE|nr:VirK/YbjX family protein [Vibrio hannami]MDG3086364.1 VirK/YbjX family protein [Vibrio hannami]